MRPWRLWRVSMLVLVTACTHSAPKTTAPAPDSAAVTGANPEESPRPRAMLGVIPDYDSMDSRVGVLILGTTPDTPAAAAGLRGGDLLVQFGNQNLQNLMDLSEALARSKPGDKIVLKVIRGKTTLSFDITLAERKG